jgi:hypothetical protein
LRSCAPFAHRPQWINPEKEQHFAAKEIWQEVWIMVVESRWKHKYEILKDYIASNPEIHIGLNEIYIPEESRDRFYGYFDNVRRAIVESWSSSFYSDVYSLAKNYLESEKQLSELSNLCVELPVDLSSFLHDPIEGMMRLVYNSLFELVQGKMLEDDFEGRAVGDLVTNTTEMFRIGYAAWAAIALILRLEPDEFFGIALGEEYKPRIVEMEEIIFGRQFHHPAKRIPEFIFHSRKLGGYIAFKMPLTREVESYYVPLEMPTQRLLRNRNGDSSSVLDDRMVFLSVVPDLKKPPVFADLHERTINGPDLTIEYLMKHDLSDPEIIRRIQRRVEIMKPRLGGIAVIMDPRPESPSFKIGETVDAFSVGLDPSALQPIIDKLA